MDERNTVTITLPYSGAVVVFYEFLRHVDNQNLRRQALRLSKVELKEDGKTPNLDSFDNAVVIDLQDLTMKALIKEITDKDGKKIENISDFIDNLSSIDGEVLLTKSDELTKGSVIDATAKKK